MGNKMQTGIIIYAVMGLMFVLIILLAAMVLQLRAKVSALQNRYRYFMTGEKGESLERQLAAEVTELREMTRSGEDMLHQHELLSNMQIRSFQRIGLVKYDAFDDSGDHLSFSLTLLDGENSAVTPSLPKKRTASIWLSPTSSPGARRQSRRTVRRNQNHIKKEPDGFLSVKKVNGWRDLKIRKQGMWNSVSPAENL